MTYICELVPPTTSQRWLSPTRGTATLSAQSDNSGCSYSIPGGDNPDSNRCGDRQHGHPGIGQRGDKLHGGQRLSERGGAVCDYHSGGSNTERKPDIQTIYVANSIMEQLRPGQLTIGGSVKGTNAGTYTATFTPKPGYQWWDGTTETKNATWTIGRAPIVVSFSPRSSPSSPLVLGANNKTAVVSVQTNAESTTLFIESQQSKEYISTNVDVDSGTITISALKSTNRLAANSTVFYVHISAGSNYTSSAQGYYVRVESLTSVFGVSWDSSNPSTALTRLTKANDPNKLVTVDITTEPVPAVGTGSGSSPFDNYMPWMGMEEYCASLVGSSPPKEVSALYKKGEDGFERTNPNKPVFVKIPEFYYKIEKIGNIFRYYIADGALDGFLLHPGSGCYVARYEGVKGNSSGTSTMRSNSGLSTFDFRYKRRISCYVKSDCLRLPALRLRRMVRCWSAISGRICRLG